jgi:hypothetical protein
VSGQRATQLLEAGLWLRLSGDNAGARRLFEQALKMDPNNSRARQLLQSDPDSGSAPLPSELSQEPVAAAPVNPFAPQRPPERDPSMPAADYEFVDEPIPLVQSKPSLPDTVAPPSNLAPPPPPPEDPQAVVERLISEAREKRSLDDHTGAMELITQASELAPTDPEVARLRQESEETLLSMYESKLGSLEAIPKVKLKDDEIIWLNLDHRAGFVLSQIDGVMTYEELFMLSGMSRFDTVRILAQLVERGVIQTP